MLLLVHIDSVLCVEASIHPIPAAVAQSHSERATGPQTQPQRQRLPAHADTQIHQALRQASCGAADCCGTAQHTQKPAISAANSIAGRQSEVEQAAQLCRPSMELCGCSRPDSRLHASSCAGAAQEGACQTNSAAAPQGTARPPPAKMDGWQCTSSE